MTALSPRELEVARLVADGLTDREISGQLGISLNTVGRHLEHIAAKVGGDLKCTRRARICEFLMRAA